MAIRHFFLSAALTGALFLAGCNEPPSGPVLVSAIGEEPRLLNPNLVPLDPPSRLLVQSTAQGLLKLNAAGEIEPALAQSWIVSDDGLRYTFRLRRTTWSDGSPVRADQVVSRLRAAGSTASRNPLKPLLGAIEEIVPMTDDVLEITLKSARPAFLQLLAQPEMGIIRDGMGTGPFHAVREDDGVVALHLPTEEEEEEEGENEEAQLPNVRLRGEKASLAVARFMAEGAEFVTGGRLGDLPIARAADPGDALRFDPVAGLFGLSFGNRRGILDDQAVRRALSIAIDRPALVAAIGVPELQPRETLLSPGIAELPTPAVPEWAQLPLPMRRAQAAATIAEAAEGMPVMLNVAMPEGPGYRLLFAHLRRDWRAIGVDAQAVPADDPSADLRLIDNVAPVELASWYLRQFTCSASAVCVLAADEQLAAARVAPSAAERRALLANADRLLSDAVAFIPLTAPVRWSLVAPRLTGFRTNVFGRHSLEDLIAVERRAF